MISVINSEFIINIDSIDIEVSIAEILLLHGREISLSNILEYFTENDVNLSKQLLHYHLKSMVKKRLLLEIKSKNNCHYYLPESFNNENIYNKLVEATALIFKGNEEQDIDTLVNRAILKLKLTINYLETNRHPLEKVKTTFDDNDK